MQQIYVLQLKDYEKQSRRMGNEEMWWKVHNHAHSGPKMTQGVAPTAQTREEATLLMLIWLEECGLVEGSESRDFGNHELLSLGLLGGMMMSLCVDTGRKIILFFTFFFFEMVLSEALIV